MKRITLLFVFIYAIAFAQKYEPMKWHEGSVNSLIKKASQEKTIVMLYICEDSFDACKKLNKKLFPNTVMGMSSPMANPVVEFHNKYIIASKPKISEVKDLLEKNNFTQYPLFLWLGGKGEILKSHLGSIDDDNFESTSKIVFKKYQAALEKKGKRMHPIYAWEKFQEDKKYDRLGKCKDLICVYERIHNYFINMPDKYKVEMYDEIVDHPGYVDSPELRWLVKQEKLKEDLKEEWIEKDDLYYTFFETIMMSYSRDTGDQEMKNEKAFKNYANKLDYSVFGSYQNEVKTYVKKELEDL